MSRIIRRTLIPIFVLGLLAALTGKARAAGAGQETIFSAVDTV